MLKKKKKVLWHILLFHNLTQALISPGLCTAEKGCLCKCAAVRLVFFCSLQSVTVCSCHICQSTTGGYTYIFQWPLVANNISWGKSHFHTSSFFYEFIFKATGHADVVSFAIHHLDQNKFTGEGTEDTPQIQVDQISNNDPFFPCTKASFTAQSLQFINKD